MQRPASHRIALILILLALATAPPALPANALHPALLAAPSAVNAADLLAHLRAWLGGIWTDIGCGIDPDGTHHCPPSGTAPNLGCTIDPSGAQHCPPSSTAPNLGCGIDPNGAQHCG
jgi:hypothetical protein